MSLLGSHDLATLRWPLQRSLKNKQAGLENVDVCQQPAALRYSKALMATMQVRREARYRCRLPLMPD